MTTRARAPASQPAPGGSMTNGPTADGSTKDSNDRKDGVGADIPPGPFPAIESYAFLSDCHTGALVATDGSVEWLCVPSFDSPSIFASVLDREAGDFRFGPYGIDHPTAREYRPGTDVLETPFRSRSGWVKVARRAHHRAASPRRRHHAPSSTADRRGRRPHAGAGGRVPGRPRRGGVGLFARVRLRPDPGDLDTGR